MKMLVVVAVAVLAGCAAPVVHPPMAPGVAPKGHNYTGGNYAVYPLCCTPEKDGPDAGGSGSSK